MRLLAWLKRRPLDVDDDDLREEIRAHLAIAEAEQRADGVHPREAHYAALREFGNVTQTREAVRRVWMPPWLETLRDLVTDVRYGIRSLAAHPTFSITVIAVLTLGIGLNAAVFTILKSFTLSPIAGVDGSARLAVLYGETSAGRPVRLSYPDFQDVRDRHRGFSDLFGTALARVNVGRGRDARQVWGELVTGNYFQVLGVGATHGRTLLPSDEAAPGRQPVAVISDGLWRRDFAADPRIVGRTIELNNSPLTVIGVTDPSFHGTTVVYDVEVYVPVTMAPLLGFRFGSEQTTPSEVLSDRRATLFYPLGYLRPGVSVANARAEADALWSSMDSNRAPADLLERVRVGRFWQMPQGAPSYILPTLSVLSAMGLLVLVIACANIAGLVLVRGVSRRGEIAVRLALGASRARIVRLLIVESIVLAIPGALLGMLLARRSVPVLVGYAETLAAPQRLFFNVGVDGYVIAFAALVACGSAIVFGFVPALQSSRVDLVAVINEDASPRGAPRGRVRMALVVAQVAVSVLLLVGAGLAWCTVDAARRADLGFDPNGVTAVVLDVKQNAYDPSRGRAFYRQLLETVRADAAIESATLAAYLPMNLLDTRAQPVAIDGYEPRPGEDLLFMSNAVGSDYFRTLRIPIAAGREFEDGDDASAEPVAVVNRSFARRFFGGDAAAIGKRIRVTDREEWRTVIGVAADIKYIRVNEAPRPYVYLPFQQAYRPGMYLHARGAASVEELLERVRHHVAALDADLPVLSPKPLMNHVYGARIFYDLTAMMLVIFGIAGMALVAMGTYGLVSYTVRQRTREIGIRLALGATTMSVVRTFVGSGVRLGVIGAGVGLVAALVMGQFLRSVLFGVSPTDVASFGVALAVVLGGVTLATIVPAWRAARTNALAALHRL